MLQTMKEQEMQPGKRDVYIFDSKVFDVKFPEPGFPKGFPFYDELKRSKEEFRNWCKKYSGIIKESWGEYIGIGDLNIVKDLINKDVQLSENEVNAVIEYPELFVAKLAADTRPLTEKQFNYLHDRFINDENASGYDLIELGLVSLAWSEIGKQSKNK